MRVTTIEVGLMTEIIEAREDGVTTSDKQVTLYALAQYDGRVVKYAKLNENPLSGITAAQELIDNTPGIKNALKETYDGGRTTPFNAIIALYGELKDQEVEGTPLILSFNTDPKNIAFVAFYNPVIAEMDYATTFNVDVLANKQSIVEEALDTLGIELNGVLSEGYVYKANEDVCGFRDVPVVYVIPDAPKKTEPQGIIVAKEIAPTHQEIMANIDAGKVI